MVKKARREGTNEGPTTRVRRKNGHFNCDGTHQVTRYDDEKMLLVGTTTKAGERVVWGEALFLGALDAVTHPRYCVPDRALPGHNVTAA